jgi:hypothetical protein
MLGGMTQFTNTGRRQGSTNGLTFVCPHRFTINRNLYFFATDYSAF